jgi:16S rRNA G966 N2-methylase RsmD
MLQVKKEFRDLIPALLPDEFNQLEQNCIKHGIQDSIKVWNGYVIDGHNRYEIAQKHKLKFEIEELNFENELKVREWMILNQFGRRNLSNYQRSILALQLEEVFSAKAKEQQVRKPESVKQISAEQKPIETRKELAKIAQVSHDTIAKVKQIEQKASPEIKAKLNTGEVSINQAYQEIKKEEKQAQREQKKQELKNTIESIDNKEKYNFAIDNLQHGWYKVNNQFLYFGSNTDREFIDFLPAAKFAFADPPYNAGVDEWDYNFKWELDYLQDKADVVAVTPGGWNACNFYKETQMNYIWEMFCWISNGMTHGRCGYANVIKTSIFGNVKPKISQDFWKISIRVSETEDTQHKGRKPYEFMFYLLDVFTKESDIVIDPFAGSGTTLIMCEQMNRISYNAEINEQYCRLIFERAGNAVKI